MKKKHLRDSFLKTVEAYCKRRGISLPVLSTLALGDNKFFRRVLAGKRFTDKSYDSILHYIADNPARKRKAG